jgi:hypothetical protein
VFEVYQAKKWFFAQSSEPALPFLPLFSKEGLEEGGKTDIHSIAFVSISTTTCFQHLSYYFSDTAILISTVCHRKAFVLKSPFHPPLPVYDREKITKGDKEAPGPLAKGGKKGPGPLPKGGDEPEKLYQFMFC